MDNKIKKLLDSFDENQLREINKFLNSSDGKRLKQRLSDRDKENLLRQIEGLDPSTVRGALSKLSAKDLANIINKL